MHTRTVTTLVALGAIALLLGPGASAEDAAIEVVGKAVPSIKKRAHEWKEHVDKRCDYAVQIKVALGDVDDDQRRMAAKQAPEDELNDWVTVLNHTKYAKEHVDKAIA